MEGEQKLYLCLCNRCYPNEYEGVGLDYEPDKVLRPAVTCRVHVFRHGATKWKDGEGNPIRRVAAEPGDHFQRPTPQLIAQRLGLPGPPPAAAAGPARAGSAASGQGSGAGPLQQAAPLQQHEDVVERLAQTDPAALVALLANDPDLLAQAIQALPAEQQEVVSRALQQSNSPPGSQGGGYGDDMDFEQGELEEPPAEGTLPGDGDGGIYKRRFDSRSYTYTEPNSFPVGLDMQSSLLVLFSEILLLAADYGLPESAVERLLDIIANLKPILNADFARNIPDNFRAMLAAMKQFGIDYAEDVVYDMCPKDFFLFRCEDKDATHCPCGHPRYKDEQRKVPYATLLYRPIRFWLERLFSSEALSKLMSWHADNDPTFDGVV